MDWRVASGTSPTEFRIQQVQRALAQGASIDQVYSLTKIDPWFLIQIQLINERASELSRPGELTKDLIKSAKQLGFSDYQIAKLRNQTEKELRAIRHSFGIRPVYKTVDTCAGEFEAMTPYYYSSYDEENEVLPRMKTAVVILGSGPNRIGQGIEFDYSCVHAAFALKNAGYETIMINCNPETVSTDYDTSDRLYFEPLTLEDVIEVINAETVAGPILGVIAQLGGQTPLGLARGLLEAGIKILGTSPDAIDLAEERGAFGEILKANNLQAPNYGMANSFEEAADIANKISYPVLVRPSYVLGGRGMEIVYDKDSLQGFIEKATAITPNHPVLIDKFLDDAIEIDVDALYDGEELYLAGVMEHIEEAGIHSGDSACVIPPQSIDEGMLRDIFKATEKLARSIGVLGLINIQYAIADNRLYVLEANPRASRTVPFVSKATGVLVAKAAALIAVGKTIAELRSEGRLPEGTVGTSNGIAVKEAVLPWNRFRRIDGKNVDSVLGPEMKSTGEVMGIANDFGSAFAKSQIASFGPLPRSGKIFISLADKDKNQSLESVRALYNLGFELYATEGTGRFLSDHQILSRWVRKHHEGSAGEEKNAVSLIESGEISLVINTPFGRDTRQDGWLIRSAAVSRGISCITTIPGLKAAVSGIKALQGNHIKVKSLQDWTK